MDLDKTDGKIWDPNPIRMCGRKHDGFYIESGPGSIHGSLSLVTLVTGDLRQSGENILCEIPPRGVHRFCPVDTLRLGEVCFDAAAASTPLSRKEVERIAYNGTKSLGLIDHVGSNHYTPVSFVIELHELGASRRVTEEMAREVIAINRMGITAIPIFFTHSRIPLLSDAEYYEAMDALYRIWPDTCYPGSLYEGASYTHSKWGMRREKWGGIWESVPAAAWFVLELANAAAADDGDGHYASVKELFEQCKYHEQLLCASWIKQVTYVTSSGQVPAWVEKDGTVAVLEIEEVSDGEGQ